MGLQNYLLDDIINVIIEETIHSKNGMQRMGEASAGVSTTKKKGRPRVRWAQRIHNANGEQRECTGNGRRQKNKRLRIGRLK
jgi:hypothetical protein